MTYQYQKKVYIETYGCQMNVNDSEVILSILQSVGYTLCHSMGEADLVLINTCSIRDNAEQRIWGRLNIFKLEKRKRKGLIVGILGCMAERLKEQLLDHTAVDLVAGPDSYRSLPQLLASLQSGDKQINTLLSQEETYADISPVRMDKNGVSAFISIMRGCNNMCAYCVVPYVRGRERSRDPQSILREARELFGNGYKEITLLGQNVNSFNWIEDGNMVSFPNLLEMVAQIDPSLRVRFSTSHPKDISDQLLHTMVRYNNICKHIHLPVQSGSDNMLKKMNRRYTRDKYLERIKKIKELMPECSLSTDIIAGFSGESEEDHQDTLSIMREVGYSAAFMFQYSERPDTTAAKRYPDDVAPKTKSSRLNEIISLQGELSLQSNKTDIGRKVEVLVEGFSKRSKAEVTGRTQQNKVVVFAAKNHKPGDYVNVCINSCTSATLLGSEVDE